MPVIDRCGVLADQAWHPFDFDLTKADDDRINSDPDVDFGTNQTARY
jgi:hypothetical protein